MKDKHTNSKVKLNKETGTWLILEPCADWHYSVIERMDL